MTAKEIKYSEEARDKVLNLVVKNFDYLREHPKELAWAMMKWRLIHISSRIAYGACEDNPKYPVMDAGEELSSREDGDLLYDAWCASCSNDAEFPDPARDFGVPGLTKHNKTLDDWVKIKTNPEYRYSSIYASERTVIDRLLCTIGTEFGWNKDGFITETGPSNVDQNIFAGYTLAEPKVRKDIRTAINKLCDHKILKGPINDYMKRVEINWGDNEVKKTILNKGWLVGRALRGKPKELIKQAEEAYEFIAYLDKLVSVAEHWDNKQWAKARKKSTWEYKGYTLDVSQVQPNFSYSPYGFESNLNMRAEDNQLSGDLRSAGILNARLDTWSSFVYKTNKSPEVEKIQSVLRKRFGKNKASKKALDKASKKIREHQPNYREHIDTYNLAYKGDEKAIAKMNKLTGIPKSGWDSVKFLVEYERKQRKRLIDFSNKEKVKTYYSLSEYSSLVNMPDNAHSSYVQAGIKVAREIVNNKAERAESRRRAKKFLKKWDS